MNLPCPPTLILSSWYYAGNMWSVDGPYHKVVNRQWCGCTVLESKRNIDLGGYMIKPQLLMVNQLPPKSWLFEADSELTVNVGALCYQIRVWRDLKPKKVNFL